MRKAFLSVLAIALSASFAGVPLSRAALHRSGERLPFDLARGVEEATSLGQDGWLKFSHFAVVSPESFPMRSPLGLHHGWPYQQAFLFGAMRAFGDLSLEETVGKTHARTSPQGWRAGFFWSFERRGWDEEDFLLIPPEGRQGAGFSGHLFGALVDRPRWGLSFGLGALSLERTDWPENDDREDPSRWTGWGHAGWGAAQGWILADEEVRGWSVSLDLEQRSLEGARRPGPMRYAPRLRAEMEGLDDSLRFEWEQPLWDSRAYARTLWSADDGFRWGELDFWFDPSRLFGVGATWLRRDGEDLFGGMVRLGLVEFGYSYAPQVEQLGGMEKSVYAKIGFGITRLNVDWYGAPGAGGFASGLVDKKAEAKKHGGTR